MVKCPGQDQRFWHPDDIFEVKCPNCSNNIEFWKDEPKRKCPDCSHLTWNPKIDIGCAQWCQYAQQCFGAADGDEILCQKLIAKLKEIKNLDQTQIDHLQQVLKYADQIQHGAGGNPLVIKATAILVNLQDQVLARKLLTEHDIDEDAIDQVCRILSNHLASKEIDTIEHKIIIDANHLSSFISESDRIDQKKLNDLIDNVLLTSKAKKIIKEIIVKKTTS